METLLSSITAAPSHAFVNAFDTEGKTLGEIVTHVYKQLHDGELEPEWIDVSNLSQLAEVDLNGYRASAVWPEVSLTSKVVITLERGMSEGWIIAIEHLFVTGGQDSAASPKWQRRPMIRAKVLGRAQAWTTAAVIARILDID